MQATAPKISNRLTEIYPDLPNLLPELRLIGTLMKFPKRQKVFSQGEPSDAIYFIQSGKVKISSVSLDGKEAVLAVLGFPAFFGEACLAGQARWLSSAVAMEPLTVLRIERPVMLENLRDRSQVCRMMAASLLIRILRLEEDVRAHFFYDHTQRLVRVLLRLAQLHQHNGSPDVEMPRWPHETLAKMVNASRSHITRIMNKLRKSGTIEYDRTLIVKTKRLAPMLRD